MGRPIATVIAGVIATLAFVAVGHAAGFRVYVSNEKDNTISVIDSESLVAVDTFKVGQRPRGITLTKDGRMLLVCASDDDTVQAVDRQSGRVVKTLPSGPDPELFVLHPSGNPLYIANEDDNLVTVPSRIECVGNERSPLRFPRFNGALTVIADPFDRVS